MTLATDYPADRGCDSAQDDDEFNVLEADLSITKSAVPTIRRGNTLLYTLTVTNLGQDVARNVVVGDWIPSGLTFNSLHSDPECILHGPKVLCNNLNLPAVPGQNIRTYIIAFDVTDSVDCDSTIENEAYVATSSNDPNDSNNFTPVIETVVTCTECSDGLDNDQDGATDWPDDFSCSDEDDDDEASPLAQCQDGLDNDADQLIDYPNDPGCDSAQDDDEVHVEPGADLHVTKVGPQTAMRGHTLTYTLTAINDGPGVATNVVVADEIPSGLVFEPAQSDSDCIQEGGDILCDNIDLTFGASHSYDIVFTVSTGVACDSTVENQASVSTSAVDPNPVNNQSAVVSTTVHCEDPTFSITKTDNRTDAQPGESLTYQISVLNTSTTDANNVTVTDTLPTGTSFLSASDNGNESSGVVTWTGLNIPNGQSVLLTLSVLIDSQVANGTVLLNTAYVGSTSGQDTTTVQVQQQQSDLSVTKTGPSGVQQSGSVTYELTAFNAGPDTAQNVVVADVIPTYLTFDATASDSRCIQENNSVLCNSVVLNAGNDASYTVVFDVSSHAQCDSIIENTASVSTSSTDPNPSNNQSTKFTTVDCASYLTISKTDDRDTAEPGDTLSYYITIENPSPYAVTNVLVEDFLPTHVTYLASSHGGVLVTPTLVRWQSLSFAPGETKVLLLLAQVDSSTPNGTWLINEASATASPTVTAQDTTVVQTSAQEADLRIIKTGASSVQGGSSILYTLSVINDGPGTALNVVAADVIPSGLIFDAGASHPDCAQEGNSILCDNISLNVGESFDYTVAFDVPATGLCNTTILNEASVSTSSTDPNPSNNHSSVSTLVTCAQGELSLSKTDGRTTAQPSETLTYTIQLVNSGTADVTNVTVADLLPPEVTFVSASDGGTPSGQVIWWHGITVPAQGSKDLTITATVNLGLANGTVLLNRVFVDNLYDEDTTTIQGGVQNDVDLAIDKMGPVSGSIAKGDTIEYEVTVTNMSDIPSSGYTISDGIPSGLLFNAQTSNGACSLNTATNSVECALGMPITIPMWHRPSSDAPASHSRRPWISSRLILVIRSPTPLI